MIAMTSPRLGWTLTALAVVVLACRTGPAAAAEERSAPVEAALKAGKAAEADRLTRALVAELRDNPQPAVKDYLLLYRLETLYQDYGYFDKAEALTRELIALGGRLPRAGAEASLRAEIELARLYRTREDYAQAERQYQRCQDLFDRSGLPRTHSVYALLQNNMGKLYEMTGQYAKAEGAYKASLAVMPKAGTPEQRVEYARYLNNLGWLYHTMHRYDEALAAVKEAKEIRVRELPAGHPDIAESFHNLGLVEFSLREFGPAERDLQKSVELWTASLGPNHPRVATAEHNLGALYRARGQFDEALKHHETSLRILENTLGPNHPDVAAARGYLASVYAARKDWSKAAEEMDRTRDLFGAHIHRVLSAQAESEQLAFLKNKDRRWFYAAVTLAVQAGADPGVNPLAADWVLNGKAVTPEVLAERTVLARQSAGQPEVKALYDELLRVRSDMAARSLRAAPGGAAGADDGPDREADLSRRLGLALHSSTDHSRVHALQVQRHLTQDKVLAGQAVLIDFVRYTPIDFQAPEVDLVGGEARYAAWVVPPEGPVRILDLGPAKVIDGAVRQLQQTLELAIRGPNRRGAGTIKTRGEPASEKEYREDSATLGRLLLGKLYPSVAAYRRWVVSPDADLWLVPWSALVLPTEDKSYAVEKHTISLVSSGRALIAPATKPDRGTTAPLIFADADFGALPKDGDHELLFEPLEYSADEGETIEPFLKRYTGMQPRRLTGARARERAFHDAQSPEAVVLSTHGFFLEEEKGRPPNPLLRCGLALAGANLRDERRAASGADDGVLFGEEILDTDLRGTDLVVLSACETALGKVRNGEGVANLQSAFQLAGAHTVVATLWEVPDEQTGLLMCDFFERLAGGTADKAEALRQAQLAYIKEHRAGSVHAAHPFFWAALTMTGQPARPARK